MKKFLVIVLIVGIFQNWGSITGFFAGEPEYATGSSGVVMYATQWCRYCEKTRKLFAKHGISYVEYDIERSAQAHREYKKLGGRGVPVVNAHGTVIHGYSPQKILAAARPK